MWFVWIPPWRAEGKGPIRQRGLNRLHKLFLIDWANGSNRYTCTVNSWNLGYLPQPQSLPDHVSRCSRIHSKNRHFFRTKVITSRHITRFQTYINLYDGIAHVYPDLWWHIHTQHVKTAAFSYDVTHIPLCGGGMMGWFGLLLPQAAAKVDTNQIQSKTMFHHMAGGKYWENISYSREVFFLNLDWASREESSKHCLRAEDRDHRDVCSSWIHSRIHRMWNEEQEIALLKCQAYLAMFSPEMNLWTGVITPFNNICGYLLLDCYFVGRSPINFHVV